MPWKETSVMKEKVLFVTAYEEGEASMAELCRQFGISRPTGYLWWRRYQADSFAGLYELSRQPAEQPRKTDPEIRAAVCEAREKHPRLGARKIKHRLQRSRPQTKWPAASTIGKILKEEGMIQPRRRRRGSQSYPVALREAEAPNDLWCIDFKGWFLTGDGQRCDPLTVMDQYSRYLIACQTTPISGQSVRPILERCFRQYGMPDRMRSDNGAPFAGPSVGGLSRLAIWLIQLGIVPERIEPGRPQQNPRHERMHRTLKQETASPPAADLTAQQARFDRFRADYNLERGHESLAMKTPAEVYRPSSRPYTGRLVEFEYPSGMVVRKVQFHGDIYMDGQSIFLTELLYGEYVGLEPISDRHWKVYYGPVPLAVIDRTINRVVKTRRTMRKLERKAKPAASSRR